MTDRAIMPECVVCHAPLVVKSLRGRPRYCDAHRPTWRAENPREVNRPQTYAQRADGRLVTGSDAELVARYQAGDEAAFEAIYRRYAPRLTAYIWRRCGDWHRAEDLVQEAMTVAARYIPRGTMHDLNGYLILCVRQAWWLRAEQTRRRPDEYPFDPRHAYRGQVGFVEDCIIEHETIREIADLVSYLPDLDRQIAMLKLFYDYDGRACAATLGMSRGAVGHRWDRTRQKWQQWAGTKTGYAALDQALILARYPETIPVEAQCRVPGCRRPRHAHDRCRYHYEAMMARRRQIAVRRTA